MPTDVVTWNNAALEAIRVTHPGPPIVARALAILHTCMFDAWAAYDEHAVGTRLDGFLRRPAAEHTDENKAEAISFAAHAALKDLFPTRVADFDAVMVELGYDPTATSADLTTPTGIGQAAAEAVISFRHGDGSNQLGDLHPGAYSDYTGYAPANDPDHINDPNRWQPLRVSDGQGGSVVQTYIAPHWGLVTPFALTSGAQFHPENGPERFPSRGYREQADEVIAYSAALTDTQKVIAEYWADGPSSELPPGHWGLFTQFVSERDGHDLDADVRLFFAVTNAIFDASIAGWAGKRAYDFVRPVTAIHKLYTGQQITAWAGPGNGTGQIDGGDWQPYQAATVVTPPFPEFYSGHSVFSAAGAEVLKRFTGSDVFGASYTQPAGSSRVEPGQVPAAAVMLSWATFSDAADEAGLSRRYGGIHFVEGDLRGREIGRRIGRQAWHKAKAYFRPPVAFPAVLARSEEAALEPAS